MKLFILGLLLMSAGCSMSMSPQEVDEQINERVSYVQDKRTGLCYARSRNAYGACYSLVPCDKVQQYIYNK